MSSQQINIVTHIASTSAAVWNALTDPDLTQRYWGGTRIESDWKVGSKVFYRVDGKVTDENTALVVEPPRELSYTFRTQGFSLVLAGAKALLEHDVRLNLVPDRFPKGLEEH